MCRFRAGNDNYADILVECYYNPEEVTFNYDFTNAPSHTSETGTYKATPATEYSGELYTILGSENIVYLSLRCLTALTGEFMTDDLKFERLDSNILKYIGNDFPEFYIKKGDIFMSTAE